MQGAEHVRADAAAARPRPGQAPNRALRALLEETEWTQEAFARAIGRTGAEAGVRLSYDRTSVAHWLRGSRPAPRVQHLIAEALSRRLGRPVAVTQLGMGDGRSGGPGPRTAGGPAREAGPPGTPGPHADGEAAGAAPPPVRTADRLAALTAAVVGPPRADAPPAAPYRLTLLAGQRPTRAVPGAPGSPRGATDGTPRGVAESTPRGPAPGTAARAGSRGAPKAQAGPPATETAEPLRPRPPRTPSPTIHRGGRPARRTTPGEVASVREHVRFFSQQADRHGGGHIRTPLAACLSGLVSGLRNGGDGPHHAQLLAGTARLSYLLARVYADEQRHGLAQRAFLTAAELAEEGGDPEGVALARRALSSQAHQLGHRRQSLALAEAACAAAPGEAAPSTRAFLYAGLAVARAAEGERTPALEALTRAEYELARTPADLTTGPESPVAEPVGAYQHAALRYQAGQVRAALGDHEGAIRELRASLRLRPEGERRTRALSNAELAELLLARGRLEEACAAWQVFLEDCALVRSGRARQARDRMPRLLHPYTREQCVQALLTRAGMSYGRAGRSCGRMGAE